MDPVTIVALVVVSAAALFALGFAIHMLDQTHKAVIESRDYLKRIAEALDRRAR